MIHEILKKVTKEHTNANGEWKDDIDGNVEEVEEKIEKVISELGDEGADMDVEVSLLTLTRFYVLPGIEVILTII